MLFTSSFSILSTTYPEHIVHIDGVTGSSPVQTTKTAIAAVFLLSDETRAPVLEDARCILNQLASLGRAAFLAGVFFSVALFFAGPSSDGLLSLAALFLTGGLRVGLPLSAAFAFSSP